MVSMITHIHGIDKSILAEWKYRVISKVDEKNENIVHQYIWKYQENMLQQKNPLQTLNYIRVGSVVTPIDKDSGIITFIS